MKSLRLKSILILVSFCLVLGITYPASAIAQDKTNSQVFNVISSGVVKAVPDIANIQIGIETTNKNSQTAQQTNKEDMSKLMGIIKGFDIKDEDIQTIEYSLYPKTVWNENSKTTVLEGYTVSNVIEVKIPIAKLGKVLDKISESKVNVIRNISFDASNREELYKKALTKAVEASKQKALIMSSVFGIEKLIPVSITENTSENNYYQPNMLKMSSAKTDMAVPIQGGTLEIKATVSASYGY